MFISRTLVGPRGNYRHSNSNKDKSIEFLFLLLLVSCFRLMSILRARTSVTIKRGILILVVLYPFDSFLLDTIAFLNEFNFI